MMTQDVTPPEAAIVTAESPFHLGRMIDMFLSRGDFDPRREAEISDEEFESRLAFRKREIDQLSKAAEDARIHATRVIQRTNDISDTIRRMRG